MVCPSKFRSVAPKLLSMLVSMMTVFSLNCVSTDCHSIGAGVFALRLGIKMDSVAAHSEEWKAEAFEDYKNIKSELDLELDQCLREQQEEVVFALNNAVAMEVSVWSNMGYFRRGPGFHWVQEFSEEVKEGRIWPLADVVPLPLQPFEHYESICQGREHCRETMREDAFFSRPPVVVFLPQRCFNDFATGGVFYKAQFGVEENLVAMFEGGVVDVPCDVALHRSLHKFIQKKLAEERRCQSGGEVPVGPEDAGRLTLKSWDEYPTHRSLTDAADEILANIKAAKKEMTEGIMTFAVASADPENKELSEMRDLFPTIARHMLKDGENRT